MALFTLGLNWVLFLAWLQGGDSFLIKNVRLEKCIHASPHDAEKLTLAECSPRSFQHEWTWDGATRAIIHWQSRLCLTAPSAEEYALVQLEPCRDRARQAWACSKKGHLTLQGQGLHLTVKQGGHKAFLSQDKDKFSRWKTMAGEVVCAAHMGESPVFSDPLKGPEDMLLWVPESKTTASAEVHALPTDNTTTSASTVAEQESNITSSLPENEVTSLEENQKIQSQHKEHQKKASSSRHSGTSWKTVMLILSLLALCLGVVILMLNIHYNKKKKKKPPALKSRQVMRAEPPSFPKPVKIGPQTQAPPMLSSLSSSPSLKHGEILIEWKDGTITPLFDHMNAQIC